MAKPDLASHDRDAKIIAPTLRDAGVEGTQTGRHQTPGQIAVTVIQEDTDGLRLSLISGVHSAARAS